MATTIPDKYTIPNLRQALSDRLYPAITVWNRLEGRPRRPDFDRALKAEVRDPLWMLTKQWQIGEFFADDAGSPVFAKALMRTSPVTKYQAAGGETQAYDPSIPMEAKAEQRGIQWTWNSQKMRFDLRAQLGRHWRKLLVDAGLGTYYSKYRDRYPITLPARDAAGDYVYAHRTAWQQYAALAGRSMDGGDFYLHLTSAAGNKASDGIALVVGGDGNALDTLGATFLDWFASQYFEPTADEAWKPEYLEYQFACSGQQAATEVVLSADEYANGHLDWYAFDRSTPRVGLGSLDGGAETAPEKLVVSPFIPAPVSFQGMPDPRWWALEDRKTDFGKVNPATTDVAQLLLMEFALVYANDWFLVPFRLSAGCLARVEGLAVTNNFGERYWIVADGKGKEDNWHRWAMFQLSSEQTPSAAADTSLFVPPTTSRTIEGDSLEEVEMARDEVANMVWAIERAVPSLTGSARSGKDEARETRQFQEQLIAATATATPYAAAIAYLAMTSVPENWIPFIPVHVPGSIREIQLQRSRMLRIIEGDPSPTPAKIPPRTTLLRPGLDTAAKKQYFIHEEEVPRAGITVSESFRRTRWTNGQAYVWLAVRKQTGRGERSSGLAFDSIIDTKAKGVS